MLAQRVTGFWVAGFWIDYEQDTIKTLFAISRSLKFNPKRKLRKFYIIRSQILDKARHSLGQNLNTKTKNTPKKL